MLLNRAERDQYLSLPDSVALPSTPQIMQIEPSDDDRDIDLSLPDSVALPSTPQIMQIEPSDDDRDIDLSLPDSVALPSAPQIMQIEPSDDDRDIDLSPTLPSTPQIMQIEPSDDDKEIGYGRPGIPTSFLPEESMPSLPFGGGMPSLPFGGGMPSLPFGGGESLGSFMNGNFSFATAGSGGPPSFLNRFQTEQQKDTEADQAQADSGEPLIVEENTVEVLESSADI